MRLLDRYLLRELLLPFAYCLGGFGIIVLAADLLNRLGDFKGDGRSAAWIAQFYLWSLPEMLGVLLPIALLLAALYALTNHSRHNELTAIRSAGISLWRLSLPYLAAGVAASLALTVSVEWLQPLAALKLQELEGASAGPVTVQKDLVFKNAADGRVWNAESFQLESGELVRPFVIWQQPDGGRREIFAQRAVHENGAWVFQSVQEIEYAANDPIPLSNVRTNQLVVRGWRETPESIRSELKISRISAARAAKGAQLTLLEIREYMARNPDLTPERLRILKTQFHDRLAQPWRCLVVVLVAVPFGSMGGRRGKFVGVASSIFIVFAYLICLRLGLALGTGGYLPPVIAVWLANVLFSLGGAVLIFRAR